MQNSITPKQEADQLHQQIINYGTMAATALYEMCRCLKRMRDAKLYTERGFASFEEYVEQDVGIGHRHAYNYIRVYEQLGDTVLQSTASLGITKLELIARLPIADRQELLDDPETATESVAELKKKVAELTRKGEQMYLLEAENSELRGAVDELTASQEELQERLNAQTQVVQGFTEEEVAEKAEEKYDEGYDAGLAFAERRKEEEISAIRETMEREKKSEIALIRKTAAADAEKAAKVDREKAIEAAVKKARAEEREKLSAVSKEAEAAIERAEKLQKELELAGNEDTTAVSLLFGQMRNLINDVCGRLDSISTTDTETADKLRRAFGQLLDLAKETIGGDS